MMVLISTVDSSTDAFVAESVVQKWGLVGESKLRVRAFEGSILSLEPFSGSFCFLDTLRWTTFSSCAPDGNVLHHGPETSIK